MDIATLGLSIDSSQVKTATTALAGLTTAATATTPAVSALATATAGLSTSASATPPAVKALTSAAAPAAAALAGMQVATAAAASAHGGLSTQAMAAGHAVRSMAEGIAMGMPPTQILAAQLNHLSYAASGEGGLSGAFKQLGGALSGFISPSMLVAAGLAAVGAAAYIAYSSIIKTELGFGELSERSGAAVQSLHAFESAAAFKGIDTSDFLKSMTQFNALTGEAQNKIGSLAELFRANGVASGSLNDNLLKAADLVQNARTEQQKYLVLQQIGLPATREWVQFLGQGSTALQQAAAGAVQFGDAADVNMIAKARAFSEEWNGAIKSTNSTFKSWFTSTYDFFDQLAGRMTELMIKAPLIGDNVATNMLKAAIKGGTATNIGAPLDPNFYNGLGSAAASNPLGAATDAKTKLPVNIKSDIGLDQQRIGILGQLATVEDVVRQKENEIALARLAGVALTGKEADAIKSYAAAQALGTLAIHQQTDAQTIEAGAIGMSLGAAAAYRAEQERLADFRLRGIALTQQQTDALHSEAQALGAATQKAALLKAQSDVGFAGSQIGRSDQEQQVATQLRQLYGDSYQSHLNDSIAGQIRLNDTFTQMKSVSQDALSGFLQDLRDGKGMIVGMQDVLTKLENKLFDIASNQIISGLFGALLPSVGVAGGAAAPTPSIFAGLGKIFGFHSGGVIGSGEQSFSRFVHPAYFDNAPRFHDGGIIGPDETPIIAKKGEGVFTPAQMANLAPAGGGGALHVNTTVNVQGGGAGDDAQGARIAAMVADSVKKAALNAIRDQRRPGGILSGR